MILIEILIIVIVALLGFAGYYFWWQGQHYVSTSDAQLSANLVTVVATAPGRVGGALPQVGETVKAGQQILSESVSTTATAKAAPAATTIPVAATATGLVAQVSVVDGQYVQPGEPLATIVATTSNEVVANIPESEISNIKAGQFVDVTIDAYPNDNFPGRVQAIVPATQSALSILPSTQSSGNYTKVTQRVPVIIRFENPNGVRLYTGLSVEVRVHISGS
ncbi:MAG: efflux RND transporter periplasmic adaptor subunit [Thermaerobacter sp.]|nr:efflux RND transporter periplasmic adaptor subunit [Thermaerobacter sp.]